MIVRAGSFTRYGVPALPGESVGKVYIVCHSAGTRGYNEQFKSKYPGRKQLHHPYIEPAWRRNSNEPKDDS